LSLVRRTAPRSYDKPGGISCAALINFSPEDKVLLEAARESFCTMTEAGCRNNCHGECARTITPSLRVKAQPEMGNQPRLPARALQFFNGLGGFTLDGRNTSSRFAQCGHPAHVGQRAGQS